MASLLGSAKKTVTKVNEGDWVCSDKSCGNVNFSWRVKCNKCGKDKGKVDTFKKIGSEIGKQAATKSGGLFSADDWQCTMCGNVNWARRNECNICKHPKFAKVEARTGVGGGYCERENVEYIDRTESDDEIDEFGRKKRQFRITVSESKEDENDSEDDGSVDLSKYDLTASDEEEITNNNKANKQKSDRSSSSRSRSRDRSHDRHRRRSRSTTSTDSRKSDSRGYRRKRSRSRSHNRRKRSRSRSHDRHRRSRSRSHSRSHDRRKRSRSRSHDRRKRSRSRSHDRHRRRDRSYSHERNHHS